jgi:BirA family biotin operon repressor/biotin-[acetyl-CoA-carboxylase] ligase
MGRQRGRLFVQLTEIRKRPTVSHPEKSWPASYKLIEFEEIDSTNEEAKRRAEDGESGPLWIRADRQLAGRGRRGRNWTSETGNLMCTLMIRPNVGAQKAAQLSFVTALAVSDFLNSFAPIEQIQLKWPNDVVAHGKKICGILLESAATGHGVDDPVNWLAIGIGVNLKHFPKDTPYGATALGELGVEAPSPGRAIAFLARHFDSRFVEWRDGGFEPIRSAWLAAAAGLGKSITARLPQKSIQGRFVGLDPSGALILALPSGGERLITAGEVFFD